MHVVAPNNTGLVGLRFGSLLVSVRQSNLIRALYVEIMPDEKIERRIDFEFLVKLGKPATESFRLSTDV